MEGDLPRLGPSAEVRGGEGGGGKGKPDPSDHFHATEGEA